MTIMPFEGINYPTLEDEYGFGFAPEPTHSDEDESYYTDEILAGWHDAGEAAQGDWAEATFDPDLPDFDPDGWKVSQNRYERWLFGE